MIAWINLAANVLWILGCALCLATLSHASWAASQRKEKFLSRLKRPMYRAVLSLAVVLFSVGMAASAAYNLEMALWLLLTAGFSIYALYSLLQTKESR